LKVYVALKVEGVKIFDTNCGQQPVDLPELFSGLRVVELEAQHLDGLRSKGCMKLANLSSNSVVCKGSLDLAGHVTVYIT
jgi:hypothetical protein